MAAAPRPTRDDALATARELFLAGERVELNEICARLGIGRTTLHRWVRDRETLLGELLAALTDWGWDWVIEHAEGETGVERAMHAGRRFMEVTAVFPPLRTFAEREPQLALRVLLRNDGLVQDRIRAGFRRAFATHAPQLGLDPELVDIAVQAGTALEWAPIAIGGEPELDRASMLILALFETYRSPQASASNRAREQ